MIQEKLEVKGIPAIIWGEPSDKVFIHVHGKMSRKECAESFARLAEEYGYQTISFDLPEHGERMNSEDRCDVFCGKRDLNLIADYVFARWKEVSLYAVSIGAYFSLQAYKDRDIKQCLFQSPIVDMKWLLDHMMIWSGVTEEQFKLEGEIESPIDTLRWDYYCYINENPVVEWNVRTHILYGGLDNLQPIESIRAFADKFGCNLLVSPDSQHPFMEENDFLVVDEWVRNNLN